MYIKTQNEVRKIQVLSALGQQIKELNVTAAQQLVEMDLDNLHGVYFLRLINQAGEQSLHKVILR